MLTWKPDLCIYHGGCDDGFGAAWAIWRRWPDTVFHAGHYRQPLPNAEGKNVLFVDFSAKRAEIDAMVQTAASIVILDHHKTAEEDLQPFIVRDAIGSPYSLCGMPERLPDMLRDLMVDLDRPPVIAVFDMEHSGAVMAWQFAHSQHTSDPLPLMLTLIEDRDLWRFDHGEETRAFSAALRTYPQDLKLWDRLSPNVRGMVEEGRVVLRAQRIDVRKIVAQAYMHKIAGHQVPVANAPPFYASEVGNDLLAFHPEAPFAATWWRRADGKDQWSLRSEDDRVDVSEIAKRFGGGGHRNAAGFEMDAGGGGLEGP
jgi:uncharacterized protein